MKTPASLPYLRTCPLAHPGIPLHPQNPSNSKLPGLFTLTSLLSLSQLIAILHLPVSANHPPDQLICPSQQATYVGQQHSESPGGERNNLNRGTTYPPSLCYFPVQLT